MIGECTTGEQEQRQRNQLGDCFISSGENLWWLGLGQNRKDNEKWLDSAYILEVDMIELIDELHLKFREIGVKIIFGF